MRSPIPPSIDVDIALINKTYQLLVFLPHSAHAVYASLTRYAAAFLQLGLPSDAINFHKILSRNAEP